MPATVPVAVDVGARPPLSLTSTAAELNDRPPPLQKGDRALELDCQRTIVEAARLLGYRVLAIRSAQNRRGKWQSPIQGDPGYPDLTLVHARAGIVFVELKRAPGGRLRPEQVHWRDALLDAGAQYLTVWVPEQMQELVQLLSDAACGVTR